jgi:phosphoserine phosphatase RsbU/P
VEELGYEATEASSGEEAWNIIAARPVNAVVSDWVMPGMDGPGLCRKIREDGPKGRYIYFILTTGKNIGRENYELAMKIGADDFITKPLDEWELAARLNVARRICSISERLNQLENLIPVCTYCNRVRRDDNVYEQMQNYVSRNYKVTFSHGICPDCMKKQFPRNENK